MADGSAQPQTLDAPSSPHAAWRVPIDVAAMAFGLSLWVVCGLAVTLLGGLLNWITPADRGKRVGQMMIRRIFQIFVGYLRWTDLLRLDAPDLRALRTGHASGAILAPNHLALWDAVFLIAACPRPACVMKNSILRNPLLGGGARLAGFIPNQPRGRMLRHAIEAVRSGDTLILFPEGTRALTDQLLINPLRGGCAIIAAQAGAPVFPVFMRSSSRFLEKGWPPWRKPRFPVHVAIDIGQPLTPRDNEKPADFTARLQATFEQELARPHRLRRLPARVTAP